MHANLGRHRQIQSISLFRAWTSRARSTRFITQKKCWTCKPRKECLSGLRQLDLALSFLISQCIFCKQKHHLSSSRRTFRPHGGTTAITVLSSLQEARRTGNYLNLMKKTLLFMGQKIQVSTTIDITSSVSFRLTTMVNSVIWKYGQTREQPTPIRTLYMSKSSSTSSSKVQFQFCFAQTSKWANDLVSLNQWFCISISLHDERKN